MCEIIFIYFSGNTVDGKKNCDFVFSMLYFIKEPKKIKRKKLHCVIQTVVYEFTGNVSLK